MIFLLRRKIKHIAFAVRHIYWRCRLKSLGAHTKFSSRVIMVKSERIEIGSNSTINVGVYLNGKGSLHIGDYVRISPFVKINTAGLEINQPYKIRPHKNDSVVIEDGVWLCTNAVINPGVTVGEGSVVAAGAVVTKNVPPFTVVAGIPAKVIKQLPKIA